jgi:hypothetical protein
MLCQTVTLQDEKINVCYDYGAAFSVLCEKKAAVALSKGEGRQMRRVVPGVLREEGAKHAQSMPLVSVSIPLGGGGGEWFTEKVYVMSGTLLLMSTYPSPSEVAQVFNLPPSDFAWRGETGIGSRQYSVFPLQSGSKE